MAAMLEVTKRAGVPKAAASRAFSRSGYVSQEVKDRVFQAIEESGYHPNSLARNLTVKTAQTLGLVITNTLYRGVCFNELLSHTARMVKGRGCQLLLADGKYSAEEERQTIRYPLDLRCDAIMTCPHFFSVGEIDDIISAHNQPIMMPNRRLRRNSSRGVWCNQEQISFSTATQLIAAGHREIGFIIGSMDSPTGVERFSSYKDALIHHGVAPNNDLIVRGKWTPACGVVGVDTLFLYEINFTALVASNGDMATGTMKQLHEHGVSVPAQVSVASFSDIAPAPYTVPILSSVKIPVTEVVQETIGRLIFMLGDGAFTPPKTFTDELIVRDPVALPVSR